MTSEVSRELSFQQGLATTRTIRRYAETPVTDEQLATMLHLATRAPSGSNRQPFRFVVLRDGPVARKVRTLLGEGAAELWQAKKARDEFSTRTPSPATARMLASMDHYVETFAAAPVVVMPCMIRYREATPTEGASIYPAVQNLLLGARSVGLGGALTMFHQARDEQIRRALGMPEQAFIAGTVTIGVPAGRHGPVRRRPLSQLVYEDGWDASPVWAVDPEGTRFTGGPKNA